MKTSITQSPSWFVRTLVMFLALSGAAVLTACEEQGPAEEMGENIDESVEEAGDAMEDAADDAEEAME
jgi:predicted small secreted protein